ncbi:MAG: hypothetical protein IT308_09885 [Anaerolineaceae bacterium]|nr:hypothetical protein [Anaerolineaceae bacterium]
MMKRTILTLGVFILVLTLALTGGSPTRAQSSPIWSSAIFYFNPADVPIETTGCDSSPECDDISVIYYRNTGETVPSKTIPIRPFESGVVLIGSVLFDETFKGSAVISSTVPLAALFRQAYNSSDPYSPILYTTLDNTMAGAGYFYLPWVQRSSGFDTEIGVQNIESISISLKLHFYKRDGSLYTYNPVEGITVEPQRSYIFRVSAIPLPWGNNFDGSVVVEANFSGLPGSHPKIVAAAREVLVGGNKAYGFEGTGNGETTWHMVSGSCSYGPGMQTTQYSIQNTSTTLTAEVQVDYYNADGSLLTTYPNVGSATINPGAALLVSGCDPATADKLTGKYFSAVVRSTNAVDLAVVGKAISKDGLMTAFNGQLPPPASPDGKYYVALPYVEFATREDGIRTYLSVLNVSDSTANDIQLTYYGRDGSLIAAANLTGKPLPAHAKTGSDPNVVRAIDPGAYGFIGAATIVSDQPVVALARVQRNVNLPGGVTTLGDDYVGMYYLKNW